jgi:hypothetical protein
MATADEFSVESVVASPSASASGMPSSPISSAYWFFVQFARGAFLCAIPFAYVLFHMWRSQESLLYHPVMAGSPFGRRCDENPPPFDSPVDDQWSVESGEGPGGLPFEEFFVDAADGVRTHGWLIWAPTRVAASTVTTIVIFHANAGNMGLRLPQALRLRKGLLANVVLWDYRGYGASSGEPKEDGIRGDAVALLQRLRADARLAPEKIVFYGTSLGGAVAVAAAADSVARGDAPVAGLILENTFLSIPSLVDHLMPQFSRFKPLVLRLKWDTISHAHVLGARVPALLLSGLSDALIPPHHMLALYEAFRSAHESATPTPTFDAPKIVRVPDAGHNDIIAKAGEDAWIRWIAAFLDSALRSEPPARIVSAEEAARTARAFEETAAAVRAGRVNLKPRIVMGQPSANPVAPTEEAAGVGGAAAMAATGDQEVGARSPPRSTSELRQRLR